MGILGVTYSELENSTVGSMKVESMKLEGRKREKFFGGKDKGVGADEGRW